MKSAAVSKQSRLTLSGEFRLKEETVRTLETGRAERRAKHRISKPFPTRVRGKDASGALFEIDCEIDNISSTGVYLRLPRGVEPGGQLDLVTRFVNGGGSGASALLTCQVLRHEPQPDGLHGLALAINQYRFL